MKAGICVIRPCPLVGRPAPTFNIPSVWRQHVISAFLGSPAANILTTAMSANSHHADIFKILSGGPLFSLPRLLLLLLWFALDTSLASPNPFLFPRLEKGSWGFLSDSILRDFILQRRTVSMKTLQRFAGKVTSFSLAVPAAW